ncbi:MAG: hypothetical protein HWD63_13230 [Candidatus Parvibacillus calidus]|nr:MAG: hypothetical protein HWD63_13230 [Candidatus Parvibacillus calidus]
MEKGRIMLILIKTLHTIIWLFFNVVIFYIVYAVLTNRIDSMLWVCYGLIILEGLTLAVFRLYCPLTVWARRFSTSDKPNFDIYLPEWLAKYNKLIYTSIVVGATVILLFKMLKLRCFDTYEFS